MSGAPSDPLGRLDRALSRAPVVPGRVEARGRLTEATGIVLRARAPGIRSAEKWATASAMVMAESSPRVVPATRTARASGRRRLPPHAPRGRSRARPGG